jgi:hypothetical protein
VGTGQRAYSVEGRKKKKNGNMPQVVIRPKRKIENKSRPEGLIRQRERIKNSNRADGKIHQRKNWKGKTPQDLINGKQMKENQRCVTLRNKFRHRHCHEEQKKKLYFLKYE